MSVNFEELDFRPTPMGVLTLRRRRLPGTEIDVYEIKLGDEFLMSSAFTDAEVAKLSRLLPERIASKPPLDRRGAAPSVRARRATSIAVSALAAW